MRANLITHLLLSALCTTALAASVEVTWSANTEPNIAGYTVYWGDVSGALQNSVSVGNVTRFVLNNVSESRPYYFVVTATNDSGLESDPSDEAAVLATRLPIATQNFAFIEGAGSFLLTAQGETKYWQSFAVEVSEDLVVWTEAARFTALPVFFIDSAGAGRPQRFYRIKANN